MKRLTCLVLACLLALSLAACGAPETETLDIFAMDTYMSLVAIGDGGAEVLQSCSARINALEQKLSRTIETSDVSRLNADGSALLDADTAALLDAALQYSAETNGAFDVTIAPLVALWGITTDSPRVPSQEEIDALLPLVGSEHVRLSGATAALDEGCAIDLGGIGKGYASDETAELFSESGISGGFVSLGGNVYVHGVTAEGKPWNVAVQDPRNTENYACTLRLTDAFVVTSGGYQRNFTAPDGTVYQHIIDPATGEVLPEGSTGELVITTLTKQGIPLVRYRTRDITSLNYTPCSCGRTHVRMNRITGRSDDMLIIRGVNVFPSQIESLLLEVQGVSPHYQLILTRENNLDYVEVQVELDGAMFSDAIKDLQQREQRIQKGIKEFLGVTTKVRLVEPHSIPRSEGKAARVIARRVIQ